MLRVNFSVGSDERPLDAVGVNEEPMLPLVETASAPIIVVTDTTPSAAHVAQGATLLGRQRKDLLMAPLVNSVIFASATATTQRAESSFLVESAAELANDREARARH